LQFIPGALIAAGPLEGVNMATAKATGAESAAAPVHRIPDVPEVILYSHSSLFYWWPVWALGFAFALLTWFQGEKVVIEGREYLFHPSKNLGVVYTVIFALIIVLTNITLRGLVSVVVIIGALFVTVLFAYLGWWEEIIAMLPYLGIYMNLGFYVFFSTAVFLVWAVAFFLFDRMEFWRIRPGQMTFERLVGTGERSYDTRGLVFEKQPSDFFRHWILGLGSGDLRIVTSGGHQEEIYVPNVLFVSHKVQEIQRLIAIKPTDAHEQVVTAGAPD